MEYSSSLSKIEGLVNYWSFSNHTCDLIGKADLLGGINVSFTGDLLSSPNSAIRLNDGYLIIPAGIYFTGGNFTIMAWVNIRAYNSFFRLIDFGNGQEKDNVVFVLSSDTNGYPYFRVWNGNSSFTSSIYLNINLGIFKAHSQFTDLILKNNCF